MVVASTFAMSDVDGTNFYLRTEGFGVEEVLLRHYNQECKFSHDCEKTPNPQHRLCQWFRTEIRSAARLLVFPLNGERLMAQSSRWFFRLHTSSQVSGLSLHFAVCVSGTICTFF